MAKPVVLDLDGVVWLADTPIPGAADAVARLRSAGHRVLFASNNSSLVGAEVEAKLARFGIDASGDVVTSAEAAASLVKPGERVLICGGPGLTEAVEGRGAEPLPGDRDPADPPDAVVVGFHREFDWDRMRIASSAVRDGARFIASNADATYPTDAGLVPGAGSILAGVATASGSEAMVAGKPHQPMADVIRARLGDTGWVVGDRPDTDGALAERLGYPWALVLTGVTSRHALPVEPTPALVAESLASLAGDQVGLLE